MPLDDLAAARSLVGSWQAQPVTDDAIRAWAAGSPKHHQEAVARARRQLRAARKRLARAIARRDEARSVQLLQKAVARRERDLAGLQPLMARPSGDKQIRQRTGLDDHLELGRYVRPPRPAVPVFPVAVSRRGSGPPGT